MIPLPDAVSHFDWSQFLGGQPLLLLTLVSIFLSLIGGLLFGLSPLLGRIVRTCGTLGLSAALLITVAQVARNNSGSDLILPALGLPEQRIEGAETKVPLGPDGHFWVTAQVNGRQHRFLVDTGATVTAISSHFAAEGGVSEARMRPPVLVRTANGT